MKAGFVGLGVMGAPMARNLHAAGHLTAVWNRTAARAEAFARETGCVAARSLDELAAAGEAVVICVTADEDMLAVVDALAPSLRPDTLVLDCSTTSPAAARDAAAHVARAGAWFLDCPVTGGTEGARDAKLAIFVGGDSAACRRAMPLLQAMGTRIAHLGDSGAGQAAKAVNQVMIAGINQAVTEGLALAQAEGLPLTALVEALGAGAAGSWFLSNRAPNMLRGDYPLGFKVELHAKDLEIVREMARRHGVQLPIVEMTLVHYRRLAEDGVRDEDISSLFRLKARLFAGGGRD